MALDLSVPDRSTRLLAEVELNPGKVEKWLASLPLLNVAEGGRRLYSTLQSYNRMDLEPERRLALLELYRAPIKHIVSELQKQYVGLPLPLADKNKSAAEQNRNFQHELAFGYKQLVLSFSSLYGTTARARADIAFAAQRAIRHLTEALLASYLSYSPPPPNLWREIHTLYRHADHLGVTGLEVGDPLNGTLGRGTVGQAYKHALLLDLGDPYHLPSRMIFKINQYLECYADLVSLHRNFERIEPNCHFLIDLESDRAGMLYSNDTDMDRSERHCLLNTVDLARHIHQQLKHLRDGEEAPCGSLAAEFYKNGGQEMLLRLINVWGVNPKRTFRRSQRADTKIEVAVGLDAVAYWINGGRRFVTSAEMIGPFPQRTRVGVFERVQQEPPTPAEYHCAPWDIKDDSAGGMSLRKHGVVQRRVKVGDLIAARAMRGDGWMISAVRWVKSPNPSNVEMGIQRLAPSALAVVIKVVSDTNQESDFLPGLLLPPVPALQEPATLLTPRNVFRAGRTLYMDDGVRLSRLVATGLIEATGGFERIAYAEDSPYADDAR